MKPFPKTQISLAYINKCFLKSPGYFSSLWQAHAVIITANQREEKPLVGTSACGFSNGKIFSVQCQVALWIGLQLSVFRFNYILFSLRGNNRCSLNNSYWGIKYSLKTNPHLDIRDLYSNKNAIRPLKQRCIWAIEKKEIRYVGRSESHVCCRIRNKVL